MIAAVVLAVVTIAIVDCGDVVLVVVLLLCCTVAAVARPSPALASLTKKLGFFQLGTFRACKIRLPFKASY